MIDKPSNPESMVDKVARHAQMKEQVKLLRQREFVNAFRRLMSDHVEVPIDSEMVIDDMTIDTESNTVIIQYKLIDRPDMNDLNDGDDDAEG